MVPLKMLRLVWRNMARSRTRLAATLGGCLVGSFIVSFFVMAGGSLGRMLDAAGGDQNLIVMQKDRF